MPIVKITTMSGQKHITKIHETREQFGRDLHALQGIWLDNLFIFKAAMESVEFTDDAAPQANDQSGNIAASEPADGTVAADPAAESTAGSSEPIDVQPDSPMPDAGSDSGPGQSETVLPGGASSDENNPS